MMGGTISSPRFGVVAVATLAALFSTATGCSDDPPKKPPKSGAGDTSADKDVTDASQADATADAGQVDPAPVAKTVGDKGGEVQHASRAKLSVPAGALPADVELTVQASPPPASVAAVGEAVGPALVLGPEGQTFLAPVQIALPVDAKTAASVDPTQLEVVLAPAEHADVTLRNMTVTFCGREKVDLAHVDWGGGAILARNSKLTIEGSRLEYHTGPGLGSAIFCGNDAQCFLSRSSLYGNNAHQGVIAVHKSAQMQLTNVSLLSSESTGVGGVIHSQGGLKLLHVTVATNTAVKDHELHPAVYVNGPTLMVNSILSENGALKDHLDCLEGPGAEAKTQYVATTISKKYPLCTGLFCGVFGTGKWGAGSSAQVARVTKVAKIQWQVAIPPSNSGAAARAHAMVPDGPSLLIPGHDLGAGVPPKTAGWIAKVRANDGKLLQVVTVTLPPHSVVLAAAGQSEHLWLGGASLSAVGGFGKRWSRLGKWPRGSSVGRGPRRPARSLRGARQPGSSGPSRYLAGKCRPSTP